jgi:AcrR family transcriptional regulator
MSPRHRSPEATDALRQDLIEVARRLVERDGPGALTMRSLAAEAGCSVGLPYKVFADRTELVGEVVAAEFARLTTAFDEIVELAGTRTVAANLSRWASHLLGTPAVALAHEAGHDDRLRTAIDHAAGETGMVEALEATVAAYLRAEQRVGRVDADVDAGAFGFLIAGAIHNLVVSGEIYPRPSARQLQRMLRSVAATLSSTRG